MLKYYKCLSDYGLIINLMGQTEKKKTLFINIIRNKQRNLWRGTYYIWHNHYKVYQKYLKIKGIFEKASLKFWKIKNIIMEKTILKI